MSVTRQINLRNGEAVRGPGLRQHTKVERSARRPRVGFLGVGWIGRHRLDAVVKSGLVHVVGVADVDSALVTTTCAQIPGAAGAESLEDLLHMNLDGLIIATPTALHARQGAAALEAGLAVFCQKPLGRSEAETYQVIEAARRQDRLLGVDMSYRFVRGATKIKNLLDARAIGEVFAADLAFHNAYGPDKPWYYDPLLSGGGCVIDLGIHLVDMVLWLLDFPPVERVLSRRFAKGKPLSSGEAFLEDYAVARLDFKSGATAQLSCSWNLPAGRDAVIQIVVYGTAGALALRNVGGSFYDFRAEQFTGTATAILDEPPDLWGGRAAVAWAKQLAQTRKYDAQVEQALEVAAIIDAIYGRSSLSN
jgi:predicted dehydrogenase